MAFCSLNYYKFNITVLIVTCPYYDTISKIFFPLCIYVLYIKIIVIVLYKCSIWTFTFTSLNFVVETLAYLKLSEFSSNRLSNRNSLKCCRFVSVCKVLRNTVDSGRFALITRCPAIVPKIPLCNLALLSRCFQFNNFIASR